MRNKNRGSTVYFTGAIMEPTPFDPADDDYYAFDADDWTAAPPKARAEETPGVTFMRAKTGPREVALVPDPGTPPGSPTGSQSALKDSPPSEALKDSPSGSHSALMDSSPVTPGG